MPPVHQVSIFVKAVADSIVFFDKHNFVLFLFVSLRPKSTAMVMAGRSVHLTTHVFMGKLDQAVNQNFVHILSLVTDNNPFLNDSAEGRRMTVEIIS